jgi:hypothetical protein
MDRAVGERIDPGDGAILVLDEDRDEWLVCEPLEG